MKEAIYTMEEVSQLLDKRILENADKLRARIKTYKKQQAHHEENFVA